MYPQRELLLSEWADVSIHEQHIPVMLNYKGELQ